MYKILTKNWSKEEAKKFLEKEGYSVYEWEDLAGTRYGFHIHEEDEVRYILDGEIKIFLESGEEIALSKGNLFYLPAKIPHAAYTENGVKYIAGTKRKK